MTDKLPVPDDYKDRIKGVRKFCTKPELEMLLIIAEGKEAEFEKVKAGKHRMKPKDFCKANGMGMSFTILEWARLETRH